MPSVSIHIVTWNSAHVIEQCLFSLQNQTWSDTALTIVDNASSDQTIALVRSMAPKATVIRNTTNVGFARAHNQALTLTHSEYALIANADVILDERYLEECMRVMEKHQHIAAVQGKLLRIPSHDIADMPQDIVTRARVLDSTGIIRKRSWECVDRGSGEMDQEQYDTDEKIFGTTGALSLYRRHALDMISYHDNEYFDELFHSYKEDIDIAHHLNKAGWLCVYVPTARAVHIRSASTTLKPTISARKASRTLRSPHERFLSYRNHLYVLAKHLSWLDMFRYSPWIVMYEIKKIIYALLFEPMLLGAWVDLFHILPRLLQKRRTSYHQ